MTLTPIPLTPERIKYHELLEGVILSETPHDAKVYDIGKSSHHDYKPLFNGREYITVDRDPGKEPDLLVDLDKEGWPADLLMSADLILCNGVTEQCANPFRLCSRLRGLIKSGGMAFFGIASLSYPPYSTDYTRFTPEGAERLVRQAGFGVIQKWIVERRNLPSYVYLKAKA